MNSWLDFFINKDDSTINRLDESVHNDISSGINKLPACDIYKDLYQFELNNSTYIHQYVFTDYPLLRLSVQCYEKATAEIYEYNDSSYADHICITNGATGAISALFEFISAKDEKLPIIFLGYHYYLYAIMAKRYNFSFTTVVADSEAQNIPTIEQVEDSLSSFKGQYLFLTVPSNPSGELYSSDEMRRLLVAVKKYKKTLVIDKCLLDNVTFQYKNGYYAITKSIINEKAEESVIIINSFSKIRSLPGARFGYIIGSKELIDFVRYYCECQYFMTPLVYILPITIDLFFQALTTTKTSNWIQIKKMFRRALLLSVENKAIQDAMLNYFHSPEDTLTSYLTTLLLNADRINANYAKTKQIFIENKYVGFTELQAGFNFNLIYSNPVSISEKDLITDVATKLKSHVFTQLNFSSTCSRRSIWLRLSCAESDEERYFSKLERLNRLLLSIK